MSRSEGADILQQVSGIQRSTGSSASSADKLPESRRAPVLRMAVSARAACSRMTISSLRSRSRPISSSTGRPLFRLPRAVVADNRISVSVSPSRSTKGRTARGSPLFPSATTARSRSAGTSAGHCRVDQVVDSPAVGEGIIPFAILLFKTYTHIFHHFLKFLQPIPVLFRIRRIHGILQSEEKHPLTRATRTRVALVFRKGADRYIGLV